MSARRAGLLAAISAPVGIAVGVLVNLVTEAPNTSLLAGLSAATVLAALILWLPRPVLGAAQARISPSPRARSSITPSGITVRGEVEQKDDGDFTGGREALAAFDAGERVLVYWGMSGLGKSRLLRRIAELHNAEIIDLDWGSGEHLDLAFPLLDRIAEVLSGWAGSPMRRFERARAAAERELRDAYEAMPPVPLAGATISDSPITITAEPAAVRAAEVRARQRKALADALADDLRRVRLAEHVLCIDTAERLRYVDGVASVPDQQSWVLDELISGLLVAAPKLRVVLAGREPVVAELPMAEFELTGWAAGDTDDYLRSRGVPEPDLHEAVHRACGGLPGWIGMAADAVLAGAEAGNPLIASEIADAARTEPVHTWLPAIFLSRLAPQLRELATNAAIPRVVTTEVLRELHGKEPPQDWFEKLSFVRSHRNESRLHPLARTALLEWLDQHEPLQLARLHTKARQYYREAGSQTEAMYHGFALGDSSEVDSWRAMTSASWQRPDGGTALALTDLVLAPECRGQLLDTEPLAVADAELVAGGIAQERHELALADSLLSSSASISEKAGHDQGVAIALLARARLALRQNLLAAALKHAEAAFLLYQHIGNPRDIAVIRELLGDLALRRDDLDVADDHLSGALAGYGEAGEPVGEADTHGSLGIVAARRGNPELAEWHFTEGLALYRANDRQRGQADMRRHLGELALASAEFSTAEEHFEGALQDYQELGEDLGVANAHQQLGELALLRSRPARARELFTRAMEICSEIDDPLGVANARRGLGSVAAAEGDPVGAQEHFFASLSGYLELDAVVSQAIVWNELATLAAARGDLADATQQLALALPAAERGRDRALIAGTKLRLGTIIAGTGRFHEGMAMLEQARDAYESMGLSDRLNSAAGTLKQFREDFERCSARIDEVSPAAQALLQLLCHLETDDRMSFVVCPAWPVLAPAFGLTASDPGPLVDELREAGLIIVTEVDDPELCRYHVSHDVLLTALADLDDEAQEAIDNAMAASWAGLLMRYSGADKNEEMIRAGLGATVYLMRQQQWAEAFEALRGCLHEADTEAQRSAVLAHLRRLAALSGEPEVLELAQNPPAVRAMVDPEVLAREQEWHDEAGRAKRDARWRHALTVNAKLVASMRFRGADPHEVTYYRFNDCEPLLELGRLDECEELLRECEDAFGGAELLAMVFTARAVLAVRRGNFDEAVELDRAALHQGYLRPEPNSLAEAHHDMANHLMHAEAPVEHQCAHRLAAFALHMLTAEEPDPGCYLGPLAITLRGLEGTRLPSTIEAVSTYVDADGAEFEDLIDQLCPEPTERAMVEEALAAAMGAATEG